LTKHELRARVQATGSHYFDRKTMRFFRDTMRNFRCSSRPIEVTLRDGTTVKAYALWRAWPVPHLGLGPTHYFHADTFEQVHPKE
jgi:hypothetical protein